MTPPKQPPKPHPGRKDPDGIRGPENSGTIGAGTGTTGQNEVKPGKKDDNTGSDDK